MKQVQTYFWRTLPIGDLISLAPILLAFSKSSQIGPSSSNHLKRVVSFETGSLGNLHCTQCIEMHTNFTKMENHILSHQTNPTLIQISILNSSIKFQIYMPHFSSVMHTNMLNSQNLCQMSIWSTFLKPQMYKFLKMKNKQTNKK